MPSGDLKTLHLLRNHPGEEDLERRLMCFLVGVDRETIRVHAGRHDLDRSGIGFQ